MNPPIDRDEHWLRRLWPAERGEHRTVLLAALSVFGLLASYYAMRPIRDEIGSREGARDLPWLFTATFVAMLVVVPVFSLLVARLPRRRFIPLTYHFFTANILVFWVLLAFVPAAERWTGLVFYVWVSVFNLFVISVFWSFLSDVFTNEQGRRLFGPIAAGGTLGAMAGAAMTAFVAEHAALSSLSMLLVSAGLLQAASFCIGRLEPRAGDGRALAGRVIGGSMWAGFRHVVSSPYMAMIAGYLMLMTVAATVLYFKQLEIVDASIVDREARRALFAKIDLVVNGLALLTQAFAVSAFIRRLGVGVTLAILPLVSTIAVVTLAAWPTLAVVVVAQIAFRTGKYAVAKPAREVLFTVVPREDKYKSKSFIDLVVYRGGDAATGWGLGLVAAALLPWIALVGGLGWLVLAIGLGRRQDARAREIGASATDASATS